MRDLFQGEQERQSRLTSEFTLLAPLRYHVRRLVEERVKVPGRAPLPEKV
jgi:hypothetical protein